METNSYDRDADGDIEEGDDCGIEINNIVENSDGNITFNIFNPNIRGEIIGYDEGGYEGVSFHNGWNSLQLAGIKITSNETAVLSGVQTTFPPTIWSWDVTDYTIYIWKGWVNNIPSELLYQYSGFVQWDPIDGRDGGWAFISFQNEQIIWNEGETYYIEIDYNGEGGVYPFEKGIYSNSSNDNLSYYRGNTSEECHRLTEIADADWNIRVVMSSIDEGLSTDIFQVPQQHQIYSNYPNPFNPKTTLPVYLSTPASMKYIVFDLRGSQVLIRDFPLLNAGYHEFNLNMSQMSSGVYFYQFIINDQKHLPQKMAFIK
jgi:hypothetical protein